MRLHNRHLLLLGGLDRAATSADAWWMIGFMPAVGALSPMADQWPGRRSAARAVTGSGGNRVLVGHQPCSCRGGHTSWTCLECGATVYGPPLHVDCRVLAGPAAVR